MTETLGTPSKPLTHHGEQLVLEERTTDPTDTSEGDAWLRVDLAPDTNQVATFRFDNGSGTWDVPVYAAGTSQDDVQEVFQLRVQGQDAYIPTRDGGSFGKLQFRHGGQTLTLHNDLEVALPDSGMFQNPIYQFWSGAIGDSDGTSPVDLPEVLAELSDATAVGGPTYRENHGGWEAVEYDATDDAHEWTPDSDLPTGAEPHSVAALIYPNVGTRGAVFAWGNDSSNQETRLELISDGTIYHDFNANNQQSNGTVNDAAWNTIGFSYDGSNRSLYINGSQDSSDSPGSVNVQDSNHAIGYRAYDSDRWLDAYIAEIVVSDTDEPESAFSNYHQDRLG